MVLSDEARGLWDKVQEQYIAAGFPYRRAWLLPLGDVVEAWELVALDLLEPRTVGGRHLGLTIHGLDSLLRHHRISSEADELRRQVAREYVERRFPTIFVTRPQSAARANELVARGFFEPFAAGGQVKLTDGGRYWIMENRAA